MVARELHPVVGGRLTSGWPSRQGRAEGHPHPICERGARGAESVRATASLGQPLRVKATHPLMTCPTPILVTNGFPRSRLLSNCVDKQAGGWVRQRRASG